MKPILTATVLSIAFSQPLWAKNDLVNTQSSQASECIDYIGSYQTILENCEAALAGVGATETQRHDMLWSLGYAQKELDQFAEATATFNEMLAMDPVSTAAMNGLGWVFYDNGETARALGQFETSLQTNPTASALAGLGKTQHELGKTDLDGALQLMDAALALDEDYGYALREKGWLLLDGGRIEEGRDAFLYAISFRSRDENALLGLARAYRELDQFEDAILQSNIVIENNPDSYFGHSERALNLFYLERYQQALKDADRAISLGPRRSAGYTTKARALSELGRRSEAFTVLEEANASFGPRDFITHWHAKLLSDDEQYLQAENRLNVTLEQGSPDRYDYQLLAYVRLEMDRFEDAQWAVNEALKINPKASYAIYLDAVLMVERGAFDEGEARFHEAMSLGLAKRRVGAFNKRLMRKGEIARAIALRETYKR